MIVRMNGWTLNWRPEGFEPAAAPRSGKGKAVAFSDGLAAFSVFVEPMGRLKMPTGASRIGATTVYMREVAVNERAFLIAVVGETPPPTARKVADGVKIHGPLGLVPARRSLKPAQSLPSRPTRPGCRLSAPAPARLVRPAPVAASRHWRLYPVGVQTRYWWPTPWMPGWAMKW